MTNEQLYDSIQRQIKHAHEDIATLERQFEKDYRATPDEEARKGIALKFEMDKAGVEGKIAMLEQEGAKVG